jgi:hypothetical protein
MKDNHVHSKACQGMAIISYVDSKGTKRTWNISASLCPLNPDTTATIQAHFEKHFLNTVFIHADIVEWHKT